MERLNAAFAARHAPVRAVHCASLWRLQWDDGQKHISLFYYLARYNGLHLYEQFGHFVTTAIGDVEAEKIYSVFTRALDELMALGFITTATRAEHTPKPPQQPRPAILFDANAPPVPGARLGKDVDGSPAWFVPNEAVPGKYLKVKA